MPSINEDIADDIRARAVIIARFDATVRRQINTLLKKLERELVAQIATADIEGDMSAATRARLETMLVNVRATIDAAYNEADSVLSDRLFDLAQIEASWVTRTFDRSAGVQLIDSTVTATALRALVSDSLIRGAPSEDWWAGQSTRLAAQFASEMRLGMSAGETLGQLKSRVVDLMDVSTRNAEALVRTSAQNVMNDARMAVYQANPDVVGELQHVSVLDDRTTEICMARDGLRWTLDGTPVGHNLPFAQPPLHWNCRSTLIPVTKSWKEMGFNVKELSPAQRASMDGTVPADQTYADWLKGKDAAFQDRVLGPTVAQLWRDGDISLRDLINRATGEPLTVEELKDLAHRR
jgi:SPP1 gp7 family putative phage head morphogenesis protein